MPKTYIDEDGNEVELLTPEEQEAEIAKKVEELSKSKKEEKTPEELEAEKKASEEAEKKKKEEEEKNEVGIDAETLKMIQDFKKEKEESEKEEFENLVSPIVEDEELKKKVRDSYNVLREHLGMDKKEALSKAIDLITGKKVNPFNGVNSYNNNSGVPGSKPVDPMKGLKDKALAALPKGLQEKLAGKI